MLDNQIGIYKTENYKYPTQDTLFRPDTNYPEYPFDFLSEANPIYEQVRECYHLLGLDEENYGKPSWNPLGEIIVPGNNVLIKPNMVMEENHIKENGTDCLYTNPSVVAAVVDYVWIALKGKGKIVIGDAPMQECKFDILIEQSGYRKLIDWYREKGVNIELVDFRELTSEVVKGLRVQQVGKGIGRVIDLGNDSEFAGIEGAAASHLRITNYDPTILPSHHNGSINEYYVSDYVLNADVVINMPKPKSHRKAGFTCAMKNFVGINVRKEYLPHHTLGSSEEGGDEYFRRDSIHSLNSRLLDKRNLAISSGKRSLAQFYRAVEKIIRTVHPHKDYAEGSWYGNNTISKTICDLNKVVLYCDKYGKMQNNLQRKILIVADMIVMGEKEGPVAPSPKKVGVIAMGTNQVLFDEAIASFVGFDVQKLPFLVNARKVKGHFQLCGQEKAEVISNTVIKPIRLEPTSGWKGHIELYKDL